MDTGGVEAGSDLGEGTRLMWAELNVEPSPDMRSAAGGWFGPPTGCAAFFPF